MKKTISFLLVLVITLLLTACFPNDEAHVIPNKDALSMWSSSTAESSYDTYVSREDSAVGIIGEESQIGIISRPSSAVSVAPTIHDTEYLSDFIGKTVGDVIAVYGNSCNFGAMTGSSVMTYSYPDIAFFLDGYYQTPTMSCGIQIAVSCDSTELVDGLWGAMTYKQLQTAVGSSANLKEPEFWCNQDNGEWIYSTTFDYNGFTFYYEWSKEPDTNHSKLAYVY